MWATSSSANSWGCNLSSMDIMIYSLRWKIQLFTSSLKIRSKVFLSTSTGRRKPRRVSQTSLISRLTSRWILTRLSISSKWMTSAGSWAATEKNWPRWLSSFHQWAVNALTSSSLTTHLQVLSRLLHKSSNPSQYSTFQQLLSRRGFQSLFQLRRMELYSKVALLRRSKPFTHLMFLRACLQMWKLKMIHNFMRDLQKDNLSQEMRYNRIISARFTAQMLSHQLRRLLQVKKVIWLDLIFRVHAALQWRLTQAWN